MTRILLLYPHKYSHTYLTFADWYAMIKFWSLDKNLFCRAFALFIYNLLGI